LSLSLSLGYKEPDSEKWSGSGAGVYYVRASGEDGGGYSYCRDGEESTSIVLLVSSSGEGSRTLFWDLRPIFGVTD
jgi:hypothetical protein